MGVGFGGAILGRQKKGGKAEESGEVLERGRKNRREKKMDGMTGNCEEKRRKKKWKEDVWRERYQKEAEGEAEMRRRKSCPGLREKWCH